MKVIENKWFKASSRILIYVSTAHEVQTTELISKALKLKKEVYLPRIQAGRKSISPRRVNDLKRDLVPGPYGILQPSHRAKPLKPSLLDLVVVPGLGFDRKGGRLGRGAGYFDRFLVKTVKAHKLGIAFKEQVVRKIPMEPHDIPMDQLITD